MFKTGQESLSEKQCRVLPNIQIGSHWDHCDLYADIWQKMSSAFEKCTTNKWLWLVLHQTRGRNELLQRGLQTLLLPIHRRSNPPKHKNFSAEIRAHVLLLSVVVLLEGEKSQHDISCFYRLIGAHAVKVPPAGLFVLLDQILYLIAQWVINANCWDRRND